MSAAPRTAVVHLVRAANGLAPFEAFLASYAAYPAGLEHDLVLLFKGFDDAAALAPYRELAGDRVAVEVHVSDAGLDITAYLAAAGQLGHDRLCFLNSYSEIAAGGWLGHLRAALDRDGVGAAGATGNWGSHLSFNLYLAGGRGPYATALPDRRVARTAMHGLSGSVPGGELRERAFAAVQALSDVRSMPRFPAAHLRTNAFLIDRRQLLSLSLGSPQDKRAAYRFEGGRAGLSAQLRAAGQRVVVVGRGGAIHERDAWDRSDTFWQDDQQQLLVHDNQTRAYAAADLPTRRVLSAFAWGQAARAGAPTARGDGQPKR